MHAVVLTRPDANTAYRYQYYPFVSLGLGLSGKSLYLTQADEQKVKRVPSNDLLATGGNATFTANTDVGLGILNLGFAATSYVRCITLKKGFYSGLLQLSSTSTFDGATFIGNGAEFIGMNAFNYVNKQNKSVANNNIIFAKFEKNNVLTIAYGSVNYIFVVEIETPILPVLKPEA